MRTEAEKKWERVEGELKRTEMLVIRAERIVDVAKALGGAEV